MLEDNNENSLNIAPGRLIWITGLAGAGKTTIGKQLYAQLKATKPEVVFLDGDQLREVFGKSEAYTQEERQQLALSYSRLCKVLCSQGIDVICATISMFTECHHWNRANIVRYCEIYIQVPMKILIERDQKQLYSRALQGEIKNVVGVDLGFVAPEKPDLILDNSGGLGELELLVKKILNYLQYHN